MPTSTLPDPLLLHAKRNTASSGAACLGVFELESGVVLPADAELVLTGWAHTVLPTLADTQGWSTGNRLPAGVTPTNTVIFTAIGGIEDNLVLTRSRVDVRVWGTGKPGDEARRSRIARTLFAVMQRQFRCTLFSAPASVPDPADNTKTLTLFTVEILLRGDQIS